MHQLTKTEFVHFLNCPKSLWLLKHDPDNYPHGEFSTFMQKLVREGYEVERYVKQYFEKNSSQRVDFQKTFETESGLFARLDAFEVDENGQSTLYEVKSSTSIKTDPAHNHLKDACFQKVCAERSGQNIDRVILIHLNKEYVRKGAIDPSELLIFADVTEQVAEITEETANEIDEAIEFLGESKIDLNQCSCLHKTRTQHCDTFPMFNSSVPTPSIYSLPRLSAKKRDELIASQIFGLADVPDDFKLTANQTVVLKAVKNGEPQIQLDNIREFLSGFEFPLHFFDYETYSSAVPLVDGASPHKHIPVQYSLHILKEDGDLEHFEFLERKPSLPGPLIERMKRDFHRNGSVVSWHASFEKTQNREMAKWFPESAEFLDDINSRMVDLEDVFKTNYVDARFDGSTSIKKVLPVICPHLSYTGLGVQDGATAMDAWQKMLDAEPDKAEQIASNLIEYCKLDTLAMVEIYRFLKEL